MKRQSPGHGHLECTVTLPQLNQWRVPAVATSLDRRGAVIHFIYRGGPTSQVISEMGAEVSVSLPAHLGQKNRFIRCLGRVKHRSVDSSGRLWLVLRFFQLHFESVSASNGLAQALASIPDIRAGVHDPSIAEGCQPGVTPQLKFVR
jgi:hypothetical protein